MERPTAVTAAPAARRQRTARTLAAVAAAVCLAALATGCPVPSRTAEDTTDTDVQRADALRADPVLHAGPFAEATTESWVKAGKAMDDSSTGGWFRTVGRAQTALPAVAADGRRQATHDAARALLADVRDEGWTVFQTSCAAGVYGAPEDTWTISAHRQTGGYTVSLFAELEADTSPGATADLTVVAPYHLDPPDLLGTPLPAALPDGTSCLDQPSAPTTPQLDGTYTQVDIDVLIG